MSKRTYGILAGVIGTAVGAWWWRRQRASASAAPAHDRGTTIFHNTPAPTALSDTGVI